MGDSFVRHPGSQGKKGVLARWWIVSAAALGAALVAMYVYQKSLEDDFELMLRAALQQYEADAADDRHGERD